MYRFLIHNYKDILNSSKSNASSKQVCCNCLFQRQLKPQCILTDSTLKYKAHYMAALRLMLVKRIKKPKKKKYVEVLKSVNGNVTSETASINMLTGSRLAAFTSQHSSTSSQRLISSDAIRYYDPLVVLPVDNPNELVNSPLYNIRTNFTQENPYCSNSLLPSWIISPIPQSISVPDLIDSYKSARGNLGQSVDIFIKENGKMIGRRRNLPINKLNRLVRESKQSNEYFSVDDSHENEDTSELVDPVAITKNRKSKITDDRKKTSFSINIQKKTREAIAKQKLNTLEKLGRTESLNANFLSYVDVCVHTEMISPAHFAIKAYRRNCHFKKAWCPKLTDIEVYNILFWAYAKKSNLMKMQELLEFVREDNVKMNCRTFGAFLDCLGRKKGKQSQIKDCLNLMKEQGISANDIFTGCQLTEDSYQSILKAIREVNQDFTPEPLELNLDYNCSLLTSLNLPGNGFSSPKPEAMSVEDLKLGYENQLSLELNSSVKIKTVAKISDDKETVELFREKLAKSMDKFREIISAAFERDLQILLSQSRNKSHFFLSIYPYLRTLPQEEFVKITLNEIRRLAEGSETYSPTTKQLFRELGTKVYIRYQMRKKTESGVLDKLNNIYASYCDWYANPLGPSQNTRQQWQRLLHEHVASTRLEEPNILWKSHVLTGIGRFLYNIIIRDVKFDANVMRSGLSGKESLLPAFYTLFRHKGHSTKEEVKPHPILARLFRQAAPEDLIFDSYEIPMSCPPVPWTSITSGGLLATKTDLIRLPFQAVSQWKVLEKTPVQNLYPALDSLNQLSAVPWMVNEEVLDVVLEVFQGGGSSKLDVPEPASSCPVAEPMTPHMTVQEKMQNFRQRMALRRKKAEMYSLWCDALYKLSLANHYRRKVFWLPHNMDFRGRVYPVAPHLNHLGSDMSRSLLIFAKGKPLGSKGLDWLKIHVINLTGTHKKQSMSARLAYANSIIDKIIDSADRPLSGGLWWTESEEPWQTLAACIEVRNALAHGEDKAAEYVSRFPVHQDGSCNGLQHYAALGRDKAGGESVNLTPSAVPQDVYSCVAALVEKQRALDAANGLEIAKILDGFIYRKVIKQTVMTTVYGVTRFGARLQIARQLKDIEEFPKDRIWQASMYLVSKTFESLQEMFTSTKEIQDWFTECARLIAQVCGENMEWVTPLGLPIVQPYSRPQSTASSTDYIKFIGVESSTVADAFERPNVMKQKNAFAPNFIHSLDSSHMMLTSLFCEQNEVTFVSVHDCYWTHACTVPQMNRICRDQFVTLHSQPILANLSKFFIQRFSYPESSFANDGSVADAAKRNLNRVLKEVPETGSLDLSSILKSEYFFS